MAADDVTSRRSCSESTSSSSSATSSTDVVTAINFRLAASSASNTTSGATDGSGNVSICRDFLRNVCRRGDRCRYIHPADPTSVPRDVIADSSTSGQPKSTASGSGGIVFCHDFQNATGCRRGDACRFAHCTRLEEAVFRRTGLLPVGVGRKLIVDAAVSRAQWNGETPICIDFLKTGNCRRAAGKCRYRHVTRDEFHVESQTTPLTGSVTSSFSFDDVIHPTTPVTLQRGIANRKRKAPSVDDDDDVISGFDANSNLRFVLPTTPPSPMPTFARFPVCAALGNGFRFVYPVQAALPPTVLTLLPGTSCLTMSTIPAGRHYDVIADRLPMYCSAAPSVAMAADVGGVAMTTRVACPSLQFC